MGRLIFMVLVLAMLTFVCYALSKILNRGKKPFYGSNRKSFDRDIEEVAKRVKMNQ